MEFNGSFGISRGNNPYQSGLFNQWNSPVMGGYNSFGGYPNSSFFW